MSEVDPVRLKARLALVEEHVKCENRHDLAALMATFGAEPRYDDEPWQDHRLGLEAVRSYYTELLASLPDLAIDIRNRAGKRGGRGRTSARPRGQRGRERKRPNSSQV